MRVRVVELPSPHVAFLRYVGPYGSGYEPDDRPCYELYRGDPTVDDACCVFRCELHLPVRRL